MKSLDDYYIKSLYPFQDGVLNIVKKSGLPFYLTGGTALSRGYFNHRFSDDLDFFVNNAADYPKLAADFIDAIEEPIGSEILTVDKKTIKRTQSFTQIIIRSKKENIPLKIDLVNDIAFRVGTVTHHPLLGRIDNWRNILSNKLAALYRYEPKDIADIWCIAKNRRFSWKQIFNEAKEKDGGIDPLPIVEILMTFPHAMIDTIKWVRKPDGNKFLADLKSIAGNIFTGGMNQPRKWYGKK